MRRARRMRGSLQRHSGWVASTQLLSISHRRISLSVIWVTAPAGSGGNCILGCRVRVANVVAGYVMFAWSGCLVLCGRYGLAVGFRPATREWGWVGSVLDHPPTTSSAGGQAPEGRLWWGGWHGM